MHVLLRGHDGLCTVVIRFLLRLALAVENHRRRLPRRVRKLQGSVRRLYRNWLERRGIYQRPFTPRRRRPWNRTPDHIEREVVRLHVEQPLLGAGQLRMLAARVIGFEATRETFRKILRRRRDLVVDLQQTRRRRPRRIRVGGPRQLWGLDLTLVWILGFFPVWILGAVDYHTRLMAFERLPWPSAAQIARVLDATIRRNGPPERLLTDRAPVLRMPVIESLLASHGIRHVITFPAHPWTNGRIEIVFKMFKRTVFHYVWLIASLAQLDRFCSDFLLWHNRDRPHGGWDGRTPDEVYFDRPRQMRPLGRVAYFDRHLNWYRFG